MSVAQFTVIPAGGVDAALPAILDHAHDDGWILHLHPAPVHYLIFCSSAEHATAVHDDYRANGEIDTEAAVVEIDPGGIHVDQDCEPGSRNRLEGFVRWIFQRFAPCTVLSHDAEPRDLSLLAARNPDALF